MRCRVDITRSVSANGSPQRRQGERDEPHLLEVLLDQVGKAVEKSSTLSGRDVGSPCRLKSMSGSLDGLVDVLDRSRVDRREMLSSGRVVDVEGFTGSSEMGVNRCIEQVSEGNTRETKRKRTRLVRETRNTRRRRTSATSRRRKCR